MKSQIKQLVPAATLLAGILSSGCAYDKTEQSNQTQPGMYLTGSNLPQNVERNGPVSNGRDDLRIIDRSDIDRSGGANVSQTLRELGVHP